MKKISELYHFTCDHGHIGITQTKILLPNMHPFMKHLGPLLWLTDLADPPTPESVGLQSTMISCNRMEYRYIVRTRAAVQWSLIRMKADKEIVATLEAYGEPLHWWVARRSLTASEFAFDERWIYGKVASV